MITSGETEVNGGRRRETVHKNEEISIQVCYISKQIYIQRVTKTV